MAFPYPYTGPISPLNNLPIEPQNYSPNFYFITAIQNGITTIVTMSKTTELVIGQEVRLVIPSSYGASPLDQQTGFVISIPNPNQVELSINSVFANSFNPSGYQTTKPQIIPVGDVNTGVINSSGRVNNGTFIPGSFINISPNEA